MIAFTNKSYLIFDGQKIPNLGQWIKAQAPFALNASNLLLNTEQTQQSPSAPYLVEIEPFSELPTPWQEAIEQGQGVQLMSYLDHPSLVEFLQSRLKVQAGQHKILLKLHNIDLIQYLQQRLDPQSFADLLGPIQWISGYGKLNVPDGQRRPIDLSGQEPKPSHYPQSCQLGQDANRIFQDYNQALKVDQIRQDLVPEFAETLDPAFGQVIHQALRQNPDVYLSEIHLLLTEVLQQSRIRNLSPQEMAKHYPEWLSAR